MSEIISIAWSGSPTLPFGDIYIERERPRFFYRWNMNS
ncbi:hypothetical protein AAZX31_07G206800 [Glycine max]